jgi:two-component system response regulator AtoC
MTAFGTIENAVEAMNLGAFNYLIKPFSIESIEILIKKAKDHINLIKENQYLRKEISKHPKIIANSLSMQNILKEIDKIAKSSACVFINGESGTGKEILAHHIHFLSQRANKPFIKVNCAAICESLIESEFFGHEKGSFTGADKKRIGRFELSDGGTLLLDEITEMPKALQSKLLRAIQEKEFERVGGVFPIKVDVRFISTSNRDMKKAISSKIFREDLFYRLNVFPITIPPIRERKKDIIPLAQYFLDFFSKKNLKPKKEFLKSAKDKLLNYSWPGNIRELSNIIERTVVLDISNQISEEHLYIEPIFHSKQKNSDLADAKITISEMEKILILKTLKEQSFNKTKTAKILGISIRTLRNKLNQYQKIP